MIVAEATSMREKILDSATRLFVARGYNGISMREIAEANGVSKAALYYHFKDKEALLLAILQDYLLEMDVLLDASQARAETARGQLHEVVKMIFSQPVERRANIRLGSQEISNLSPQDQAAFGHLYHEKFIGKLAELLQRGMERGEFRPMDPMVTTWLLLGMMYPFFYPAQERSAAPVEQTTALLLDVFLNGVAADAHE